MEKVDINRRVDEIRKRAQENGGKTLPAIKSGEKICPFSLSSGGLPCGAWCQLYRPGKSKYACPLQEIPTISWNTRKGGK